MPEKVTLNRPNGSQLSVNQDEVEEYGRLGYTPETAEQGYNRNIEQAREDYFTTPGQRTVAGLEGFVNGLTVGGYTSLLGGGEDEMGRAEYNPGTRLGGELVGAILPALVPGGAEAEAGVLGAEAARGASLASKVAGATPMGLLSRGAEAGAEALTATKTGHALVRGAIEGGVMGAGAAATDQKLSGDPVTAEAVLAGMGWGALWGGGLGYVGGKLQVHAERLAAEAAEKEAAKVAAKAGAVTEEGWTSFRNAVDDVHKTSKKTIEDAVAAVAGSQDAKDTLTMAVLKHVDEMEAEQKALFNRIDVKGGGITRGAPKLKKELKDTLRAATKAMNDDDYAQLELLSKRHANVMGALADLTKVAKPELEPFVMSQAQKSSKALDSLKAVGGSAKALDDFPFTAEEFRKMTGPKVTKVAKAVDDFIANAPVELQGQKAALSKAVDGLVTGAGVETTGTLTEGQRIRQTWETLKASSSKAAQEAAEKVRAQGFGHSTVKYAGGLTASHMARAAGGGVIARSGAYEAGAKLASGLLALKAGVLGTISTKAAAWSPAAAKALKFVGPKMDPLKVRLDGTLDNDHKGRKELMKARMEEMRNAAPTIKDTLFRAVEPIAGQHPEFAASISKVASDQFAALIQRMPRDPGLAFSKMKSLWTPDGVMMEQFARAYEAFHNPIGVGMRWLDNPQSITPEGAAAFKQFHPELFTHLRVEMINRISEPGVLDKMSYSEQVGLGQLLDLRIHSSQDPAFIQAQQLMFQQRKEPLPARPSASGNASNNPSGTASGATASQRITEH